MKICNLLLFIVFGLGGVNLLYSAKQNQYLSELNNSEKTKQFEVSIQAQDKFYITDLAWITPEVLLYLSPSNNTNHCDSLLNFGVAKKKVILNGMFDGVYNWDKDISKLYRIEPSKNEAVEISTNDMESELSLLKTQLEKVYQFVPLDDNNRELGYAESIKRYIENESFLPDFIPSASHSYRFGHPYRTEYHDYYLVLHLTGIFDKYDNTQFSTQGLYWWRTNKLKVDVYNSQADAENNLQPIWIVEAPSHAAGNTVSGNTNGRFSPMIRYQKGTFAFEGGFTFPSISISPDNRYMLVEDALCSLEAVSNGSKDFVLAKSLIDKPFFAFSVAPDWKYIAYVAYGFGPAIKMVKKGKVEIVVTPLTLP